MASDLKARSIKISDATWNRWQAMAGQSGGVTALITRSVDGLAAAIDRAARAERRVGELEGSIAKQGSGKPTVEQVKPIKGHVGKDEQQVVLSLPVAFLAQMIPGDKVAMMEDEVLRRFGYGLFRKVR